MTQDTREWEDQFDEMEKNHGWIPEHKQRVKDFIHHQLQKAREEERKRVSRFLVERGERADDYDEYVRAVEQAELDQDKK